MEESSKFIDITVAIDKLEKIGMEGVLKELENKGISTSALQKLKPFLEFEGSLEERLGFLSEKLASSETGKLGIGEFKTIFNYLKELGRENLCELDLTLARGLNYYTGTIIEVQAADVQIGSICGGGRYDDLTGIFGLPDVSGVGISFGADRIYDVMHSLNLFPDKSVVSSEVLFINFGGEEELFSLKTTAELRERGIRAELYPEPSKIKKQMKYADQKKIPYVVLAGSSEIEQGRVTVKNMQSGEQAEVSLSELAGYFNSEGL
jgi:histidyl-tRNA synthetase